MSDETTTNSEPTKIEVIFVYGGIGLDGSKKYDQWYNVTGLDYQAADFSLAGLSALQFTGKPLTKSPVIGGYYKFQANKLGDGRLSVYLGGVFCGTIQFDPIIKRARAEDDARRIELKAQRIADKIKKDTALSNEMGRLKKLYKQLRVEDRPGFLAYILNELGW